MYCVALRTLLVLRSAISQPARGSSLGRGSLSLFHPSFRRQRRTCTYHIRRRLIYSKRITPSLRDEAIDLKARCPSRIGRTDRKSTRLNSSHVAISYAVFCLKKKKI